jgi:hypothetical protein
LAGDLAHSGRHPLPEQQQRNDGQAQQEGLHVHRGDTGRDGGDIAPGRTARGRAENDVKLLKDDRDADARQHCMDHHG